MQLIIEGPTHYMLSTGVNASGLVPRPRPAFAIRKSGRWPGNFPYMCDIRTESMVEPVLLNMGGLGLRTVRKASNFTACI